MRSADANSLIYVVKAVIVIALLVLVGVIFWYEAPPVLVDPGWIEDFLKMAGWMAPFIYIFLRVTAIVVAVIPNAPLDIAGGLLFGPFLGTIYSLLGSEAGAIVCFLLARYLSKRTITRLFRWDITFRNQAGMRQLGYIVFFARLVPVFSFALVSYGIGLTGMPLRSFAIYTLIGMIPGTAILNYYGKSFFSGGILLQISLGFVLVVLLFVIPAWIRRKNPWGLYGNSNTDIE